MDPVFTFRLEKLFLPCPFPRGSLFYSEYRRASAGEIFEALLAELRVVTQRIVAASPKMTGVSLTILQESLPARLVVLGL